MVTIHPFEDGNGRIARAIADMELARSEHSSRRFYSMSAQIRLGHKQYYDILESTQKGPMDVTHWMLWFLVGGIMVDCVDHQVNVDNDHLRSASFRPNSSSSIAAAVSSALSHLKFWSLPGEWDF